MTKDEGLCSSEFQLQYTVSTCLNSLSEVLKSGAAACLQTPHSTQDYKKEHKEA